MFKEIKNSGMYEVCKDDSVSYTHVYSGFFNDLEPLELEWAKIEGVGEFGYLEVLTLDEIVEQARDIIDEDYIRENGLVITVFIQEPLKSKILQYGNYGDSWWQIGETMGYA